MIKTFLYAVLLVPACFLAAGIIYLVAIIATRSTKPKVRKKAMRVDVKAGLVDYAFDESDCYA
jgi:hypothetical protein